MAETDATVTLEDIHRLAGALRERPGMARLRPLLESTWAAPEAYLSALLEAVNLRGPSLTSRAALSVNLYQDLVGRHLLGERVALVYRDPNLGWREVPYRDLHEASSRLAATWSRDALAPGTKVAIVMPVSGPMVVALLTCLRLGLVACYIPPLGRTFVQDRLQLSGAARAVLGGGYAHWLGLPQEALLPAEAAPGVVPDLGQPTHAYGPADPALCLFSALGPPPVAPVERGSAALLGRIATDAALVLGLGPDDRVAAPGFDPLQHQPALLLAALFAGATWVEVSEPQLEDDDLLRSLRLSTVGVTHRVRDRIMQDDVRMAGWRRWFKNPAAPYDWGSWSSFSAKAKAAHLEGQNVLVSASYGGALLFSPPTLEPGLEVLPAPGIPWMLAESLTSPNPTSSDSGVLVSTEPDAPEAAVGRFLLGDLGHGMFLAGSADEGKAGTTYPAEEVVAVAERHPAVDGASVVVNRGVRTLNSARIVLLLFVDPASDPRPSQGRLIQEVEESLRVEMGQDNLPDQLRVYPLAPRLTEDGGLDHDWCRWQFLTGQLQMKASDELFRLTSLARRLATPSPA